MLKILLALDSGIAPDGAFERIDIIQVYSAFYCKINIKDW